MNCRDTLTCLVKSLQNITLIGIFNFDPLSTIYTIIILKTKLNYSLVNVLLLLNIK